MKPPGSRLGVFVLVDLVVFRLLKRLCKELIDRSDPAIFNLVNTSFRAHSRPRSVVFPMRGTAKWRIHPLHMERLVLNSPEKLARLRPHMTNSDLIRLERLVDGYSRLISELMDEGRKAFYLNFMFHQLSGLRQTQMRIMEQEVERVHCILMRHIVRRPKARRFAHLRPIFFGCPDLPVFKWNRDKVGQSVTANDGLHFNVVALVPPRTDPIFPVEFQYWLRGPLSRLTVPLDQHFQENERKYLNRRLARIDVTQITEGTMADYTLKTFKNGRVDEDSILVLK
jgi:hypothetical protein